jgi:carboxylesterase type B
LFLLVLLQSGSTDEPTIVHTNYGDVLGYQTDMARVFYGIPFAQPPFDRLR